MSLKTLLLAIVGFAAAVIPARASNWGHLQNPFAPQRQLRERLDFGAEEKEEISNKSARGWLAAPSQRFF